MKFKITVCGDKAVGKTSYIKRLLLNQYNVKYIPTTKLGIYNIKKDNFEIDIWDLPSSSSSLKDAYLIKSDLVILIFDVCNEDTYDGLYDWYKDIQNVDPTIPITILANKSESVNKEVEKLEITFHQKYGIKSFDVSCKLNKNIKESFDYILTVLEAKEGLNPS